MIPKFQVGEMVVIQDYDDEIDGDRVYISTVVAVTIKAPPIYCITFVKGSGGFWIKERNLRAMSPLEKLL